VEHPDRNFFNQPAYRQTIRDYNCQFVGLDFVHQPLPFPDAAFSIVTFSETLEHLPVERINFVFSEIRRVLRPGGLLILSSPNQASLENRIRLGKGKSVLELPADVAIAKGTYGHIRLYTTAEMTTFMSQSGFSLEHCVLESNNSAYRGASVNSLRRRLHRFYERAEQRLNFLRGLADTWYMVFRKK
jgi:SAM-dependent methyltransferase